MLGHLFCKTNYSPATLISPTVIEQIIELPLQKWSPNLKFLFDHLEIWTRDFSTLYKFVPKQCLSDVVSYSSPECPKYIPELLATGVWSGLLKPLNHSLE